SDGRFQLKGVGRDREIQFRLEGPGIEYGPVRVLARAMKAPVEPTRPGRFVERVIPKVYGATFEHAAAPSRPIHGVVRDKQTGKPVARAGVHYNPLYPNPAAVRLFGPNGAGTSPCSWTMSGADGSYSLVILPGPGVLGFIDNARKESFMTAHITAQDLKNFFK